MINFFLQENPNDVVEEIMRDPRYRNDSIWQRISNWINNSDNDSEPEPSELIQEFDSPEFDTPDFSPAATGSSSLLIIILVVAAVILIIALIAFLVYRSSNSSEDDSKNLDDDLEVYTTRKEWLRKAEEAENQQEHSRAVYCRFKALTSGLSERSEVPESEALTSGEYRQQITGSPNRVKSFTGVTSKFEHVRYGGRTATFEDSHSIKEQDIAILSEKPEIDSSDEL